MAETITKRITAVNENGFKVEGYENWFNLSTTYQGTPIPPVGTEIEFKYNPWPNPKSGKTVYYVNEIIPVTQVAAPAPSSYDGLQQAAAPAPVASAPAPTTPTPVAEPPRNGPESVTPDPGSFAYRDTVGIPRAACLKDAVEALTGICGAAALEPLTGDQLANLAVNIVRLANLLYRDYYVMQGQAIADVAMPDDTLVPTPSEMTEPPPEYRG